METHDLILKKARFSDWEALYRNVWRHEETARYMLWTVTPSEEEAQDRMRRTIAFQKDHDAFTVYEKSSGEAIGWAGFACVEPGVYEETSIALGPAFTGKGYGRQILDLLTEHCKSLGGHTFHYSTRSTNHASRALAAACGFLLCAEESRTDPRTGEPYTLLLYKKEL